MSIIAIDPGTRATGLVHMDADRVYGCKTLRFDCAVGDDNDAMVGRCLDIECGVLEFARACRCDAIVIEGFTGFSNRRGVNLWQTPWLCGWLIAGFEDVGEEYYIQTSSRVLNPRVGGNCAWVKAAVAEGREVITGALACTNDHTRSALAHGIWFYTQGKGKERANGRVDG